MSKKSKLTFFFLSIFLINFSTKAQSRINKKSKAVCEKKILEYTKSIIVPNNSPLPSTHHYNGDRKLRISKIDNSYLADLYLPLSKDSKKDYMLIKLKCNLNFKCKGSRSVMYQGEFTKKKNPEWDLNDRVVGLRYGGRTILSFTTENKNKISFQYTNLINEKNLQSGMVITCEI